MRFGGKKREMSLRLIFGAFWGDEGGFFFFFFFRSWSLFDWGIVYLKFKAIISLFVTCVSQKRKLKYSKSCGNGLWASLLTSL